MAAAHRVIRHFILFFRESVQNAVNALVLGRSKSHYYLSLVRYELDGVHSAM